MFLAQDGAMLIVKTSIARQQNSEFMSAVPFTEKQR